MADLEKETVTQDDEIKEDPNIVDFDGPDDPENPFNWPTWKKGRQLALMSFNTFITWVAHSNSG
jgi:hypothetical protein